MIMCYTILKTNETIVVSKKAKNLRQLRIACMSWLA